MRVPRGKQPGKDRTTGEKNAEPSPEGSVPSGKDSPLWGKSLPSNVTPQDQDVVRAAGLGTGPVLSTPAGSLPIQASSPETKAPWPALLTLLGPVMGSVKNLGRTV